MDSAPINRNSLNEIELLKKEIELLKNEIKLIKQNCIYKIKIDTLKPKDLRCTIGKCLDDYISIEKDGLQYGPYKSYEQGKYLIVYNGDSLLNAYFDVIDNGIEDKISITFISKTQTKVVYEIIIPGNLKSGIEFRAFNKNPHTIISVKSIEVFKYNI